LTAQGLKQFGNYQQYSKQQFRTEMAIWYR
jgi:hypothetical protein